MDSLAFRSYQIQFRPGLCPGPTYDGAYDATASTTTWLGAGTKRAHTSVCRKRTLSPVFLDSIVANPILCSWILVASENVKVFI